ncbi:ParA family protein, partial [Salmonella enterica]
MENIEQLRKVATRAGKLLTSLSESIRQQKEELKLTEFYQEYSKAALYKLPKLSKGSVEYAVAEMEASGYIFKKKPSGNTMKYAMTIQNVIDLYFHRKVPKYRDRFDKAFTIFVCNLKGGGS